MDGLINEKVCNTCGISKPLFNYHKRYDKENTYRGICKPCDLNRQRNYRNRLDISVKRKYRKRLLSDRMWQLKSRYGLSVKEYEQLRLAQNNVCAICQQPERVDKSGRIVNLSVDHSHTSNTIRALLCRRCNSALGLVGDDITILERMIAYIRRFDA